MYPFRTKCLNDLYTYLAGKFAEEVKRNPTRIRMQDQSFMDYLDYVSSRCYDLDIESFTLDSVMTEEQMVLLYTDALYQNYPDIEKVDPMVASTIYNTIKMHIAEAFNPEREFVPDEEVK